MTGASFSVPFFCLSVGTGDRRKLLCALLLPQRGHRGQEQASLCPSSASAWAQGTGASFSVPLNQGMGRYTQNLIITPRITNKTGICAQAPIAVLTMPMRGYTFVNFQVSNFSKMLLFIPKSAKIEKNTSIKRAIFEKHCFGAEGWNIILKN